MSAEQEHDEPGVISLDRWTKERRNLRIAGWLEEIAGHIRNGRTVCMPDRVLLVLQSGNERFGADDFECLHLGLTQTVCARP